MSAIRFVLVTGVAGSGKTTVGTALARRLGWPYHEADDYHPPSNVARMTSGRPLREVDRAPWLAALRAGMDAVREAGGRAVFSCSALREAHRELLTAGCDDVLLVHLTGEPRTIERRIRQRSGHFFDPALLASQFEVLEASHDALAIDIEAAPDAIVDRIVDALG